MALNKVEKKAEKPAAPTTIVLELALYTNYTYKGFTYQKGKPYRFSRETAVDMLSEFDSGRPVWRVYNPPAPKTAPKVEVVDATAVEPVGIIDDPVREEDPKRRIEVGSDDEIRDILNPADEGNVTI